MTAPVSPLQYGYPLTCPVCDARFTRLAEWESHMSTAHSPETAPPRATTPEPHEEVAARLLDVAVRLFPDWVGMGEAFRATLASSPPGAVAGASRLSRHAEWCAYLLPIKPNGIAKSCDCGAGEDSPAAQSSEIAGLLDKLELWRGLYVDLGSADARQQYIAARAKVDAALATLSARIAEAERVTSAAFRVAHIEGLPASEVSAEEWREAFGRLRLVLARASRSTGDTSTAPRETRA